MTLLGESSGKRVEPATGSLIHPSARLHPTAIIEDGVSIGAGTSIWDHVHVRPNARIGENCILGEKTYIAYDVRIGNCVKINSFVYVCTGVTIEDYVMISAGTVFTNDRLPRAFKVDGFSVKESDPTEDTLQTVVQRGVSIGAHCTIGPGIRLGEYCLVGMGSVLTRSVEPFHLVYGNPAKFRGLVCICGNILTRENLGGCSGRDIPCSRCHRNYVLDELGLRLHSPGGVEGQ